MITTRPIPLVLAWTMCIASSLSVAQEPQLPAIQMPFRASNFCVDPSERYAIVWNLVEGQANRDVGSVHNYPFDKTSRIAVVDLATSKVLINRIVAAPIIHAEATEKYVVVYPWATGRSRLDILTLPDLKLRRSWRFSSSIESFDIDDSLALVNAGGGLQALSMIDFEWVRRWHPTDRNHVWYRISHGTYFIDGAVMNRELKPQCLLHVSNAPVLPLLPGEKNRTVRDIGAHIEHLGFGPAWAAFAKKDHNRDPMLISRRNAQPLTKLPVREYEHAVVRTVRDTAYLLDGHKILIWKRPKTPTNRLRFATKQTTLVLGKGGETKLEHEVLGGSPPYLFRTEGTEELGYSINNDVGTITLDNSILRKRARTLASTRLRGTPLNRVNNSGATQRLIELRNRTRNLVAATVPDANKVLAIAAPVHIEVTDSENQTASIRYFIWIPLPLKEMYEHTQALDIAANKRISRDEEATPEAREKLAEASRLVKKLRAELLKQQREEAAGK